MGIKIKSCINCLNFFLQGNGTLPIAWWGEVPWDLENIFKVVTFPPISLFVVRLVVVVRVLFLYNVPLATTIY